MNCLIVSREMLGILFVVALLARFIDSNTGSVEFLMVPALIAVGCSSASARDQKVIISRWVFLLVDGSFSY